MKSEQIELLHEQGINERLLNIVDFSKLFELMLLIGKGKYTTKEASNILKRDWNLSENDFNIFFYGKFPNWLHEYMIDQWSEYIGKGLDKELFILILEQEIDDWEDVFYNESSFYYLLSGMEDIHSQALVHKHYKSRVDKLENQLNELDRQNIVTSTKLDILREYQTKCESFMRIVNNKALF